MSSLPHLYTELLEEKTFATSSYADVAGSSGEGKIPSDDLVGGQKYFIHAMADIGNSSTSRRTVIRLKGLPGGADLAKHEQEVKAAGTNPKHLYRWAGVIDDTSYDDDIVLEAKVSSTSGSPIAYVDNVSILAIDLSDLDENTDYYYNEKTTSVQLPSDGNFGSGHAEVTVTADSSEKWLVFGTMKLQYPDMAGIGYGVALYDGTDHMPMFESVWESGSECITTTLSRAYTISSNKTFSMEAKEDISFWPATAYYSSVFAIKVDAFDEGYIHEDFASGSAGDIPYEDGDDPFIDNEEIGFSSDPNIQTSGKYWVFGGFSRDYDDADNSMFLRLQEGSTDLPVGVDHTDEYEHEPSSGSGHRQSFCRSAVYSPGTGTKDFKLQADCAEDKGSYLDSEYYDPYLYVLGPLSSPGDEPVFIDGLNTDFTIPSLGRDFEAPGGGRNLVVPPGGRDFTL